MDVCHSYDGQSGDLGLTLRTDNNVTIIRLVGDTLQAPVAYATGINPQSVAIGDVNGDQVTALVTANAGTFMAGDPVPSFVINDLLLYVREPCVGIWVISIG